jgi:hypothetical protein
MPAHRGQAAMAVLDQDILRVARSLIRRYGDEARRHALQRIAELLDEGDSEASALWERVADAVDQLMSAP